MKIATWNVNSLRVREQQVLDWLQCNRVDVLALQELKLTQDRFAYAALEALGYRASVFGQKTYNGVALLTRDTLGAPHDVVQNIPTFADAQARLIAATVHHPDLGAVRALSVYCVNGQAPQTEKFEYKMSWFRGLREHLRSELEQYPQLVLMGDFNIAREDQDSYDPQGLRETIHHTQEERAQLDSILKLGLFDAFRLFAQPPQSFTWWDYRDFAFNRKRGLRLDYILVSEALRQHVRTCEIDLVPRKNLRPSDHTPVVAELA